MILICSAVLLVGILVSFSKPEILVKKQYLDKMSDEQAKKYVSNMRWIYGTIIFLINGGNSFIEDSGLIGWIFIIAGFVILFTKGIPAFKQTMQIKKDVMK